MRTYNKENKEYIMSYLFNIPIHDSSFKEISYDKENKRIFIILENKYSNNRINIVFTGVKILFSFDSDSWGTNETVSSLTLETDFSIFKTLIGQYQINVDNEIYLMFQMFSGNEIHIICKEVSFELYHHDK